MTACVYCRSTEVSKLADTSISTTSFGRQQLANFSDHYLSDFVLHGTSDEDVTHKVRLLLKCYPVVVYFGLSFYVLREYYKGFVFS